MREPTTTVTCAPNCGVSTTPTTTTPTESSAVGGKLAQSYVKDAQVWADQLVNGEGNLEWDAGEPLALSGEEGDYYLISDASWVLSGDFQIVTSGGKKTDSSGNWIDAAPMVAPAPEPGQTQAHVTPLTTLVAFAPELKEEFDKLGGWNADIASSSGVSGSLLRIAKTVETLSKSLSEGSSPVVSDFGSSLKSLGKLATTLKKAAEDGKALASEDVLKESSSVAIDEVLSDPVLVPNPPTAAQQAALKNSVTEAVQGIAKVIDDTDEPVVEAALLDEIEKEQEKASVKTLGGKLAQKYVKGAQVWADRLVDNVSNLEQDTGEPLALSGENGDYQLTSDALWVLSGDFIVVTSGGQKTDSNGNWIDAAPMLAPAPESDQTEVNVTPLTTLVVFEPTLKEEFEKLGGWNADIASPNGVSGKLLRIAKTVEVYSVALSGGSSPIVSDFNSSFKSLEKLAATLKSAAETGADLASGEVLEASTSSAIDAVLSDSVLVSEPPSVTLKAALKNSVVQAVQGIAAVIPATDDLVVENSALLAQIEQVLREAGIVDEVSITMNMGSGKALSFGAVITAVEMTWVENTLFLTATVADDDPDSLDFRWFTFSQTLKASNPNLLTTEVTNFDGTNLKVLLTVTDSAANTSDTRSCTWQFNPTICEF